MANYQPTSAQNFGISVDGVTVASFSELQGITAELDVIEHRESTDEGVRVVKTVGNTKLNSEIKFKMAMGPDLELNSWFEGAQSGHIDAARKSCSLVMYDATNKPVARYYLENAWPTKCVVSPMRAGGSDILQQEWTLTYEAIQRVL